MSATKIILTSVHGKRLGLSQAGNLLVNGHTVPMCGDEGAIRRPQPTPPAINVSATLTGNQAQAAILTSTTAAAVAAQLPTAAQFEAALTQQLQIDEGLDVNVINTGANTFTLTVNTGMTIVGNAVVAATSSGTFRIRKTAALTYVAYRIA